METDFIAAVASLIRPLTTDLFPVALVFVRMGAIAFLAPALGEPAVSPRVRLAGAVALTMIVAPLIETPEIPSRDSAAVAALIGAEAAAGLLIGFSLRLSIFALQFVGAIASQVMSLSQIFGPGLSHDQESPLSTILIAAGLALACAGGLHLKVAVAAAQTYDVLPFGVVPFTADSAAFASEQAARTLVLAFGLAAPFAILGMAYAVALAAASRAMPQLSAVFVGAPAIVLAGLTLFAGSATIILARWSDMTAALVAAPLQGLP